MQPCCEPGGIGTAGLDLSQSSAVAAGYSTERGSRLPQSKACGGNTDKIRTQIESGRLVSASPAEGFGEKVALVVGA